MSVFKLKFKGVTEYIKKKGGLEVLNKLPNAQGYGGGNSGNM